MNFTCEHIYIYFLRVNISYDWNDDQPWKLSVASCGNTLQRKYWNICWDTQPQKFTLFVFVTVINLKSKTEKKIIFARSWTILYLKWAKITHLPTVRSFSNCRLKELNWTAINFEIPKAVKNEEWNWIFIAIIRKTMNTDLIGTNFEICSDYFKADISAKQSLIFRFFLFDWKLQLKCESLLKWTKSQFNSIWSE